MNGLPSFLDLAQASKPQMMPNSPSVGAGLAYGQDQGRHDAFLRQSTGLAGLQAQMAAMQAEEQAAGNPGRMAGIRTKNALAADDEAGLPQTLEARGMGRENAIGAERQKKIQEAMKELEPFVNAWSTSDEPGKKELHEIMKEQGVQFGSRKLGDMPIEQLDTTMRALRKAQEQSMPNVMKQREIEGKDRRADVAAASREKIAEARMRLQVAIQNEKNNRNPRTINELTARFLDKEVQEGRLNARDVIKFYAEQSTFGARAATERQPGTAAIKDGKVVRTRPTSPPIPSVPGTDEDVGGGAPPAPEAKKDKFKAGVVYTDSKSGKKAKYLGDGKWEAVK
jgi:hypothetical protein